MIQNAIDRDNQEDRPVSISLLLDGPREHACPQIRLVRPLEHGRFDYKLGLPKDNANQRKSDADLVIIQRTFPSLENCRVLKAVSNLGVPIIYDTDDDFMSVDEEHPNYFTIRERLPYIRWALHQADLITTSTPKLAESLRQHTRRPVHVQPNLIDWSLFYSRPRHRQEIVNVLISGTPTHARDWKLIEEPLRKVLDERRGRVIAHFFGAVPSNLVGHQCVRAIDFEANYEEYASILRGLDINFALVPLENSSFNLSKSNIKWLEYSACGIPGVYSDVLPYRTSITHGIDGLLVTDALSCWTQAINTLIDDPALCNRLAIASAASVKSRYSIEACIEQFEQPLQMAKQKLHKKDILSHTSFMLRCLPEKLKRDINWLMSKKI